jgi:hypothetical protein
MRGLLYQLRMIDVAECGAVDGMRIVAGEGEVLGENLPQ